MSIDTVFDELRKTVEAGVTDPSDSPYFPPFVIVKKKKPVQIDFVSTLEQ